MSRLIPQPPNFSPIAALVTDAPDFQQRVQLGAVEVRERDALAYLKINHAELTAKP